MNKFYTFIALFAACFTFAMSNASFAQSSYWFIPYSLGNQPMVWAETAPDGYTFANQVCAQYMADTDSWCTENEWDSTCYDNYLLCAGEGGCMDENACNFSPFALVDDTSCFYQKWFIPTEVGGGPAMLACYAPEGYEYAAQGCVQTIVDNDPWCVENFWDSTCNETYNACVDGSNSGCNDPAACNFDGSEIDDGSCFYSGTITTESDIPESVCIGMGFPEEFLITYLTVPYQETFIYYINQSGIMVKRESGNVIDYSDLPAGSYGIQVVRFAPNISIPLEVGDHVDQASGCFAADATPYYISIEVVEAGEIAFADNTYSQTVLLGDNVSDNLEIIGSSNDNTVYVLTDSELDVVDFLDGSSYDAGNLQVGTYHIWGFAYTGEIMAVGDSIFDLYSTACWDFTDYGLDITVENATSVEEELESAQWTAFPNPTKNMLTLRTNGMSQSTELAITDLAGRAVVQNTQLTSNQHTIDMSDLPIGCYLVTLSTPQGQQTLRVLKE